MEIFSLPALLVAIFILAIYLVGGAVYRLYLSPLAKFPGPKLAALTLWYEFYFDVVKKGRYGWEIAKMHEQYGRIGVLIKIATCAGSNPQPCAQVQSFALILTRSI